jgi:hypothetical protein
VQNLRELYAKNSRMDLLIPLVILALCCILLLAVIIYIRRRWQSDNRKASLKLRTLRQTEEKGKFGMYAIIYNLPGLDNYNFQSCL